jgi:serine/threonine protein kinase
MLQTKERLGDFEIIRLLGRGGMGEVYEARQFNPDRTVALKVLAPWLANDDEALQRFFREASVPANLDHPGIVRIISTSKPGEAVAYYAMYLVRGISLAELIRRGNASPNSDAATKSLESVDTPSVAAADFQVTPLSPAPGMETSPQLLADYRTDRFTTLARIGAQAARALAYAHQQGHLHRDIKPSNLMIDHHDQVYLVDFGLTRGLEPAGSGTLPGAVIGTPWYMSPEQAEGKPLEVTSDIYSLGVTLYELASQGLGPFTANREDKKSVLAQVRAGQTLPLRTLAPGIPPALEKIILKAMHLRPHKRYESAAELARDLEAFLGIASRHTPHSSKKKNVPAHRRWPMWVGIGLLVASLVMAIAVAVAMRNREPGADAPFELGKLDGAKAWPDDLRKQRIDVKVSIMKANNEPLWKLPLFGEGSYKPGERLSLLAPNGGLYVLGLTDPDRHCFDFSIEVGKTQPDDRDPTSYRTGIAFGWRRRPAESDEHPRFFVVELDEHPRGSEGFGQLKIGTGWVVLPAKGRAAGSEWFSPLPGPKGTVPLDKSYAYHTIHLKVRRDRASVSVNNGPAQEFSVPWLREADPRAAADLDPRGTIAIWAKNGTGNFRNAALTLIADDQR